MRALNPDQRRAVTADHTKPANVVAGAGTGKTTVLVQRYLELLRSGIDADRILALTFTLKSASEMRHRIHEAVASEIPEKVTDLYGAWIMNFHQFGLRVIKDNAPAFGIDPGVDVMTPAEFKRIGALLRRRFNDGAIEGVPHDFGGEIPPPTKMDTRFDLFFDVALRARGDMIPLSLLHDRLRDGDEPGYRAYVDAIVAVGRAYNDELSRRRLIDFTDMITIPARGMSDSPRLASYYSKRFDHILVDEFQDTSKAQNDLLRILSGGDFENVTVVGDEKQSIYRWRDARVENILEFPGERLPLRKNYRSRQNILDLAHAFIARTPGAIGDSAVYLDAARGESEAPVVLFHPEAGEDFAEAEGLAAWIEWLAGRENDALPTPPKTPLGFDDITILLRSLKPGFGLPAIETALTAREIPYAVIGGANAAETRALDGYHAYLSLLMPGDQTRALLTVLEQAPITVPDASLYQLLKKVKYNKDSDWLSDENVARVDDDVAVDRIRRVRELRDDMRSRWATMDFRDFIMWTLSHTPLQLRLVADGLGADAVSDLTGEVLETIDTLQARGDLNLAAFLENLRASIDERKFREDGDVRLPAGRVRVMTIHQSKGLEFPAVAVAGMRPQLSRSERFFLSREEGVFFSSKEKSHWARGYDDTEAKQKEDEMAEQEARCLAYVALTRARDFLWVSSPFADGIKGKRASLFSELLEVGRSSEGVLELRELSTVGDGRASRDDSFAGEQTVAVVEAVQRRAETAAEITPPAISRRETATTVATWADVEAFIACPRRLAFRDGVDSSGVETVASYPLEQETDIPPAAIPSGVDAADYGILVHAVLERILQSPGGSVEGLVQETMEDYGHTGAAIEKSILALVSGIDEIAADGSESARVEEPFYTRVGNVIVQGVFDRIERTPDGWLITDYKVGQASRSHDAQVAIYCWALSAITGEPVSGRVAYLRPEGVSVVSVDADASRAAIAAAVAALGDARTSGDFGATPGEQCTQCPYRAACSDAV